MHFTVPSFLLLASAASVAVARSAGNDTLAASLFGPRPRFAVHPDTTSYCSWWYDNVDGSIPCEEVPVWWEITQAQWTRWNPVLRDSCDAFTLETSWCVDVSGEPEVPPEPSTTTTALPPPTTTTSLPDNGIETPQPTQPGMVDDCDAFHFVESGDSCESIATQSGISMAQFLSWNTDVGGASCTGLWLDAYVCVSVLGHEPEPSPTNPGNGIETPQPTQPGMVNNCDTFHLVESGDSCDTIAAENGISLTQFVSWNTQVGGAQCTGLWLDTYVCVSIIGHTPTPTDPGNGISTPTPIQSGMVDNCDEFHFIEVGQSCDAIIRTYRITLEQFTSWNPAAGARCTGLWAETWACVSVIGHTPTPTDPGNGISTPSPIQDGMTGNCNRFHLVRADQTCEAIGRTYGVTVQQLTTWNPAVGAQCRSIWANTYLCVGVL